MSPTPSIVQRKVYLTFPAERVKEEIICDMYDRFQVRFNIRMATITETTGLVALELSGDAKKVNEAIDYFKSRGLTVEPIEMTVVAS